MDRPRAERTWHTRFIGLHDEDDMLIDRAVALDMTPDERMQAVTDLAGDLSEFSGQSLAKQRLQRSVTVLKRRKR